MGSRGSSSSTNRATPASAQTNGGGTPKSEEHQRIDHLQERIRVSEAHMADAMAKREVRAKQLGRLQIEDLNSAVRSSRRVVQSGLTKREKISLVLEAEHPVQGIERIIQKYKNEIHDLSR